MITSKNIYDQRTLQTNWVKAFPAITQGQEFPWNLNSKKDNNINFHLSTLPAKINKLCKIKKKLYFWIIIEKKGIFIKKSD